MINTHKIDYLKTHPAAADAASPLNLISLLLCLVVDLAQQTNQSSTDSAASAPATAAAPGAAPRLNQQNHASRWKPSSNATVFIMADFTGRRSISVSRSGY
jgi:hypothetical protein